MRQLRHFLKHNSIFYQETQSTWSIKIICIIWISLFLNNLLLRAEGTNAIAPNSKDAAALFIGAGNTGTTGGNYGLFAWKGSDSKLSFNVQNTCEKVYFGFSIPKNDRSFRNISPITGGSDTEQNLIFRILDPTGNPINKLSCFGNITLGGEVWQTLRASDVNLKDRNTADAGPRQLGNPNGYDAFELDLSACGLTLTGNYSIEFYHGEQIMTLIRQNLAII